MAMVMFFSIISDAFMNAAYAVTAMPIGGTFYFSSVQINNGSPISGTSGYFGTAPVDTNVPVNSTFKLTNTSKVFLNAGSWDPETGALSTSKLNSDMVVIRKTNGEEVQGITVTNDSTTQGYNASDTTVNVSLTKPLEYDTNYELVVKQYFTKVNKTGTCMGGIQNDVVIPFKTVGLPKPALTKAELRGSNLRLEGLPQNCNLEYNLAADGQFDNGSWKPFSYTGDTANIEVSNITLTTDSKVMVGYDKGDNSVPTTTSDPIAVLYASSGAPSFSDAVLKDAKLTLEGLPNNALNMEYQIAADGQNYDGWKDLTVSDTKAVVDITGLSLAQGQSMIQVRYKAIPPSSASEAAERSFVYDLGMVSPLIQGNDTTFTEGIKVTSVNLNTPGENETNTVAVRNAAGEKLSTVKPNMGFVGDDDIVLYPAGGIYGFNLNGSGDESSNHIKITIPFSLPAKAPDYLNVSESDLMDSSKIGIYMLSEADFDNPEETWQYWNYLDTTIDSEKNTATVDISGFDSKGKDIILAIKYDRYTPNPYLISPYTRTDNSITFQVEAADASGIKELTIKRMNRNDSSDVKYITLSSEEYPGLRDFRHGNWIMWTDNDLKHGTNYDYIVSSATDMLGNKSDNTVDAWKISATLDSAETLVKETQDWIYANLQQPQSNLFYQPHIVFAPGDKQDSVTQKIDLPVSGIISFGANSIEWTSDRPDIIKVAKNGYNEVNLPVDENGNPAEAKVTLTGKITYTIYNANESSPVTATGTVTVPVNVKWNIVDGQVIIATEYSELVPDFDDDGNADDTYVNDPVKEINKAVNFDDSIAKTILLKHTVDINREPKSLVNDWSKLGAPQDIVIDGHGKTIKADFDGALFRITQNGGSFTLKNAVIDMNHKNGTILMSDSYPCKKVFENVKVINAENCQYGVVLGSVSENAVTDDGKEAENSFTADKCEFSSFVTAAIGVFNSLYSYTYNDANYHTSFKYEPIPVKISNCTFDGEGKPGYAVVDAFGKVSIDNSTFRNYKGNVSTGWNSGNDSFERFTKDAGGNYCYLYKGIPDASPSAAVLVKELGSADLKGNTVKDCDNSILVWTGEKNFSFLEQKPDSSFTAYCTVNGVKVDSTTAGQAADSLFKANTINGVEGSTDNRIVISDASDRYNLVTLAEKSYVPETAVPEAIEGSTSNTAAISNDTSSTSLSTSTSTSAESVGNAIERTSTGSGIVSKESASAVNSAGSTEQTNKDNIAGSIKSDNTNKVSDTDKQTKNFFGTITVTNWFMLAGVLVLIIIRGIFIFRNKKSTV